VSSRIVGLNKHNAIKTYGGVEVCILMPTPTVRRVVTSEHGHYTDTAIKFALAAEALSIDRHNRGNMLPTTGPDGYPKSMKR
jgi:hypothetical protein